MTSRCCGWRADPVTADHNDTNPDPERVASPFSATFFFRASRTQRRDSCTLRIKLKPRCFTPLLTVIGNCT